jgi:uncharacterized membrane protein YdjX (TVP38/TMEM64 family)
MLLLVAAAVIVPYMLFGEQLESAAGAWLEGARSRPSLAAAVIVALLASDVVLPVPSSIVGVFAGATLGLAFGAVAIWCGLMLGCVAGYWLGRLVPSWAVAENSTPALGKTGPLMLAATRAIPVLAETGIIAAGAARMGFGQVMLVTALANLLVALAYAGAGALLATLDPVLVAIVATVGLAMAWGLLLLARRP